MSRVVYPEAFTVLGFPRVSGDEPRKLYRFAGRERFSPRERG